MKMQIHSQGRSPGFPEFVEWEPSERDRQQAEANHGQTLERLNERGGLGWDELAAVLLGQRYTSRQRRDAAVLCIAELAARRATASAGAPTLQEYQDAEALLQLLDLQRDCTAPDIVRPAQILAVIHWLRAHTGGAAVAKERAAADAAYTERNRLVALLAAIFPSVRTRTAIEGWGPEWHGCVFVQLPTGQASWHYHDDDAGLFAHVPQGEAKWDGHSTPAKYERVARAAEHYVAQRRASAEAGAL